MRMIEKIQKEHGAEAALAFRAFVQAYYELRMHRKNDTAREIWSRVNDEVGGSAISYANDRIDEWLK
jgi:hypothetical protein